MTRAVTLVAGPPCAGKSTYVEQHAQPGDLILDQDAIGITAMRAGLARIAAMTHGTAWVVRCCPGPQRRRAFAQTIRATNVVLLNPGEPTLIHRATRRPDPLQHIQAVRDWLAQEAQDLSPRATPRRAKTTTERGLGWKHQQERAALLPKAYGRPCGYCGKPMLRGQKLHLDHPTPRALGGQGGQGRMVHARCNVVAGARLGVQLRRSRTRSVTVTDRHSRRW